MALLRNREVKRFIRLALLVAAAATWLVYSLSSVVPAVVTGLSLFTVTAAFLQATLWRYRQLIQLNDFLRQVNRGDYSLDLEDNDEGELSILRSEIYKVMMTLREHNERLKQEKTYLSNSLSDISHQLKTPLTSMFVMTDLLCDSELASEQRDEFTGRIRAQLERLQWLVGSLLKLSRLDAGTVQFNRQPVQLRTVIDKACAPLLIPAEIKDVDLSVEVSGEYRLVCDVNWTAEALLNILKNAIEHTPSGGAIRVTADCNTLYGEIVVTDSGAGLSKEDLPHIFNRFYKGRRAGEDSVGIGLAMAKSIVEAQGGSLAAGNAPGQGASFVLRFPQSMISNP